MLAKKTWLVRVYRGRRTIAITLNAAEGVTLRGLTLRICEIDEPYVLRRSCNLCSKYRSFYILHRLEVPQYLSC